MSRDQQKYDEGKERVAFEDWYVRYTAEGWSVSKIGTWEAWKARAKSRS